MVARMKAIFNELGLSTACRRDSKGEKPRVIPRELLGD